jgi:ABC-type nickel/cobalt efflux system permease component RcnA
MAAVALAVVVVMEAVALSNIAFKASPFLLDPESVPMVVSLSFWVIDREWGRISMKATSGRCHGLRACLAGRGSCLGFSSASPRLSFM